MMTKNKNPNNDEKTKANRPINLKGTPKGKKGSFQGGMQMGTQENNFSSKAKRKPRGNGQKQVEAGIAKNSKNAKGKQKDKNINNNNRKQKEAKRKRKHRDNMAMQGHKGTLVIAEPLGVKNGSMGHESKMSAVKAIMDPKGINKNNANSTMQGGKSVDN